MLPPSAPASIEDPWNRGAETQEHPNGNLGAIKVCPLDRHEARHVALTHCGHVRSRDLRAGA